MDDKFVTTLATGVDAGLSDELNASRPRAAPSSIYHLHPGLAGGTAAWSDCANHAAALGFEAILLAPPFASGMSDRPFRARDFDVLHHDSGGSSADPALAGFAALLRTLDMALLLDIAIDKIDRDAVLVAEHPDWFVASDDGLDFRFISEADTPVDWWDARIAAWQKLGIAGFRCEAAHRVPASVWKRLIGAAKTRDAATIFIATTFGATARAIRKLSGCGFDFAASSACWWDFRAGWLADDVDRIGNVGKIIAFAAPPFEHSGEFPVPTETAARRALELASFLGDSWIMPMNFASGMAMPASRLTAAITTINARRRHYRGLFEHPARIVSPPSSDVVVLARGTAHSTSNIFLLNASLEQQVAIPFRQLRIWLGEAIGAFESVGDMCGRPNQNDTSITLAAGGASMLRANHSAPIVIPPRSRPTAESAVAAPRIAIEAVTPAVENGRFATKRLVGDHVTVEADLICDGHGVLAADLLWRGVDEAEWWRTPMTLLSNDRWFAGFQLERLGRYLFTIEVWVDRFGGFVEEITKKHAASVPIDLELTEGIGFVESTAHRASARYADDFARLLTNFRDDNPARRRQLLSDPATIALMRECEERCFLSRLATPFQIDAERKAAGFASWYEIFPRSQSGDPSRHGTFDDVIAQLPRIRAMGFDVLYFPPIHPIGRKNRKGRNNALTATPADPGSPYAIGAEEGGYDAIHPELGTFDDFQKLLAAAAEHGLEIALDFAIQCAPDHPWLREHPEWFDWRPDGSIKYAENPPKKYEDIVNVDFYTEGAMPSLWVALRDVVVFWVDQGIRIFRVDNPHTKPLPFWEWLIGDIRAHHPDVIFLAEAFTRPKLMYRLAKLGFSQSYTYFTWRNTAQELKAYLIELTETAPHGFFRPHFFVNTPDINPVFLQTSGRPGFLIRAALAATLSGLWGVYNGFELCESQALPGREEYLNSEKYQIRAWDHDREGNIIEEITALNRIRRHNPALHSHLGLTFLPASNDQVLYFEKSNVDRSNVILVAIGFDPFNRQDATIELPLWRFGLQDDAFLQAEDLVRGVSFAWQGKHQMVSLDPREIPYCIWRVCP